MREGAWAGRRAFILGGGPSLNDVDQYLLRNELTLGLNMAFLFETTAALIYDKRLMDTISMAPMWQAYQGEKFWLNAEDKSLFQYPKSHGGVQQLREYHMQPSNPRWPTALADGLYRGNNAGTAGICLVDVLRADPIYLLGFDLRAEAGKPTNWHQMYPAQWRATDRTMKEFRDDLTRIKGFVRGSVINLTPGSALNAFPKQSLESVLGVRR